jgi:Mg2+/Co2+ transporter CorB
MNDDDPRCEPRDEWNLPDDESQHVAGLVIHEAQIFPLVRCLAHGFRFEVLAKMKTHFRIEKSRRLSRWQSCQS